MKRAIVLGGGGSRGSYELGVWTALREIGIGYDMVTGTSIGSLNGALMAQDDYELARQLWRELTINNVMENGINLGTSIEEMLNQKDSILPFLKKYVTYKGADIAPLRKLLGSIINEERLRASRVGFGLVAVGFPTLQAFELTREDIPPGLLQEYLLASAACFPAFPMQKIKDKTFIDGGYYDNLPIRFAFRMGAEEVIAVDLSFQPSHREYLRYPQVKYIHPSWNLGSILMFEPELMAQNTTLGYNDGHKALGRFFGFRYTFSRRSGELPREYDGEAARFSALVAQLEADLAGPERRALPRWDFPLTEALSQHTDGRLLTSFELWLRGLELCAELLELDHLRVYELPEFIKALLEKLSALLLPEEIPDSEPGGVRPYLSRLSALSKTEEAAPVTGLVSALLQSGDLRRDAAAFVVPHPRELAAALAPVLLQYKM